MVFTMLIMEGCDFYYSNGFWGEVWVNFSSMLELASFCLSVIYSLPPYPMGVAYTEFVEYKQSSS